MNKQIEKNKCVIYLRVASMGQKDHEVGLEKQRIDCFEFCRSMGYEITEIFADAGVSKIEDKTGLQHMIGYLNEYKDITTIVCTDPSRLTRQYFEHILLKSLFREMGISVKCINLGKHMTELDMVSDVFRNIRNSDNLLIRGLLDELMEGSK